MMDVLRRAVALAVLGLILAGCTGGGDGGAEPVRSAATPVATPTASPAPTATPTPTASPAPTATRPPTPKASPSPTPTATPTPEPTPTPALTPTATPTPSPTPRPAATRKPAATPTPTLTATPTPTPVAIPTYPEIIFVGEVPPDLEAGYRAAMHEVVAYYADRYGVEAPEFAVYLGADIDAVRAVYAEVGGGSPETFPGGGVVTPVAGGVRAIFLAGRYFSSGVNSLILSHEYFHVLQGELSENSPIATPRWLVEGSAVYESMLYSGVWERYRPAAVVLSANNDGALRDLEQFDLADAPHAYGLGALASEWLAEQTGGNPQVKYWQLLAGSATWEEAFESAFGIAVDESYEAFEEHLEEVLSELATGRVEGIVLGPGSEALPGIGIGIRGTGFYKRWFIETDRVGTFDLHVLDGMFRIRIYTRDASGTLRHIGWYGEGGFTTDIGQATVIEVDGTDVTGIEIRLPGDPADLPTARIPRVQGTVGRSDGEPAEGIRVWVWGSSTEDSKFSRISANGTFDIDHQNGTFTIRVYILRDGVIHQIGWYGGEDGFTTDREQATVIEVDGADVTGIEIHLPVDFVDLPTIFS